MPRRRGRSASGWASILAGALGASRSPPSCCFPLMFPPSQSASFFSTTLLQEREPFDFLNLYIPTNPFYSLANNVVPAVVLFSIVVGVALIGVPNKAAVARGAGDGRTGRVEGDELRRGADADRRVRDRRGRRRHAEHRGAAAPAGLSGQLRRVSLLLSLWVLPGLVAALTPVPYRALLSRTRDALVTAFMTTSLFAVLPLADRAGEGARPRVRRRRRGAGGRDRRHRSRLLQLSAHRQAAVAQLRAVRGLVRGRARAAQRVPAAGGHRTAGHVRQRERGDSVSAGPAADSGRHVPPVRDLGHRQRAIRHAAGGGAHRGDRRARHVRGGGRR